MVSCGGSSRLHLTASSHQCTRPMLQFCLVLHIMMFLHLPPEQECCGLFPILSLLIFCKCAARSFVHRAASCFVTCHSPCEPRQAWSCTHLEPACLSRGYLQRQAQHPLKCQLQNITCLLVLQRLVHFARCNYQPLLWHARTCIDRV